MPQPIDLYYWPTPNGWKISIALEEMGLPYNVRLVDIYSGDQFDPEFLKISPGNRMPAIVDPDGPDGAPVSIFESGAILQYLARKTGRFHGETERERIAVDQWLFWQVGHIGPMAGQVHHFVKYAPSLEPPQVLPYAQKRYLEELARLYRVLDRQLAENRYVAGDFFSIADMAIYGWASLWEGQKQTLEDKPNMARWLDELRAREGVARGMALHSELRNRKRTPEQERQAQKILFTAAQR